MTFNTRRYEASHDKSPRGFGAWGFCDEQHYDKPDYLDHVMWSTGTFADAKRAAREHFKNVPNFSGVVVVCS